MIPAHSIVEGQTAGGRRPVMLVHGILGSQRNWRAFARQLVERRPDLRLLLLDLRGHGDTPPAARPHTLAACARDLGELARLTGWPRAIIGHSFGGKVALTCAGAWKGLERVFVLDSPPGSSPGPEPGGAWPVSELVTRLSTLAMPVASRAEVTDALLAWGYEARLASWMVTNLRHTDGGLVWRFDLAVVRQLLTDYFATDMWPLLGDGKRGFDIHLLRGGRSEAWSAEDVARLEALHRQGVLEHDVLPNAGHWLHADDPDGLASWLAERL